MTGCLDPRPLTHYTNRMVARSEQIEDRILTGLALGKTLSALCREKGMPSYVAVTNWIKADPDFSRRVAEARDVGYDAAADAVLDIADEKPPMVQTKDGERLDAGYVAWQRLRGDMRMKLLERRCPERYGAKTQVDVGNKDGQPLKVEGGVDTAALTLKLAAMLRGETTNGQGD